MKNIVDLPEEVLSEIFKRLDSSSYLRLWETCEAVRPALKRSSVIRNLRLTSSEEFKGDTFEQLGPFVAHLDVSSLPNLTFDELKNTLPYFSNLRELDVTNTRVSMWEASEVCNACPQLTSLATQFNFFDLKNKCDQNLVEKCQLSFSRLQSICFTAPLQVQLLHCGHILKVLQRCQSLRTLRIELSVQNNSWPNIVCDCTQPIPRSLKEFSVNMDENRSCAIYDEKCIFGHFLNSNWYFVSMMKFIDHTCLYTKDLNKEWNTYMRYDMNMAYSAPDPIEIGRFDAWHKDLKQDYPDLCKDIRQNLETQLPVRLCRNREESVEGCTAYQISPCVLKPVDRDVEFYTNTTWQTSLLNADEFVKTMPNLRVMVDAWCNCRYRNQTMMYFDPQCKMLKNLSYLCISDCAMDASLTSLFDACLNLETFCLINTRGDSEEYGFCNLVKNIYRSRSIKNFMLVDRDTTMEEVISIFPHCPNLLNVVLSAQMEEKLQINLYEHYLENFPNVHSLVLDFYWESPNAKLLEERLSNTDAKRNVKVLAKQEFTRMFILEEVTDVHCDVFGLANYKNILKLNVKRTKDL